MEFWQIFLISPRKFGRCYGNVLTRRGIDFVSCHPEAAVFLADFPCNTQLDWTINCLALLLLLSTAIVRFAAGQRDRAMARAV